jgi:GntR family transcriptional regulator/MocR family aminotransferase
LLEITPILNETIAEPLYVQLYQFIKNEICTGVIVTGTRLPSIRQLSSYLKVSRNTVDSAYQQLITEGYVESRPRSGLFVMSVEFTIPAQQVLPPIVKVNNTDKRDIEIDFRYGNVDSVHFPFAIWKKLTLRCLSSDQYNLFTYGDPQGEYELRLEIAKYLRYSRGVSCSPEQVVIGSGIQQLMSLLSLLIKQDRYTVAIEDPGYDGVRSVFERHGFHVKPIPLDEQGIKVNTLYNSKASVVYVTPSHQFPCGMIMPYSRRMQLLKWAEERDGIIIEDDYDGEFRYVGNPIPALQGLTLNNNVVYAGSFSKSFLPSIRMGYMILPMSLLERYKQDFGLYDHPVSIIHQMTLHQFMEQGHWERHIRRMRNLYQKKQALLIREIKSCLGDIVSITGNDAGLHILLEVRNGMTEKELIEHALTFKVGVYPVSRHWMESSRMENAMVQLGFGGLTDGQIIEGIKRLKKAWIINMV